MILNLADATFPRVCGACPRTVADLRELRLRLVEGHPTKVCPRCMEYFDTPLDLRTHYRTAGCAAPRRRVRPVP